MSCSLGWWKLADGNYVNPAKCTSVYSTALGGGSYGLEVDIEGAPHALNGSWASDAAAKEAARELIQGVDPATFD